MPPLQLTMTSLRRYPVSARTLFGLAYCITSSCTFFGPTTEKHVFSTGRFEVRAPKMGREGIVIAAPHGQSEPDSDTLARALSDRTGAGLVTAYGFKSRRLSVIQPIVHSGLNSDFTPRGQRGSVFRDYKRILRATAGGEIRIYIGVHRSSDAQVGDRIEVVSSGLTIEEAIALKQTYKKIRDDITKKNELPHLFMAIEPLDQLTWRTSGVKHHGVLLIAEKGLNLRIPKFSSGTAEALYTRVLARWLGEAIRILCENPMALPQIQVQVTDLGRLELIQSRKQVRGVVIAAPHGTFDENTSELVRQLGYRTGFAAVIAKGFTPTETGGWRINVNRPTEKTFPSEGLEFHSRRARETFQIFKGFVFTAARGPLQLYIDIHQYGTGNDIQIATVGVSTEHATRIKTAYEEIRDRVLKTRPDVGAAKLLIEPLDQIEIGAWPAKAEGMLALVPKSLHIELPYRVLATPRRRETYRTIFTDLLTESVPFLLARDPANLRGEMENGPR